MEDTAASGNDDINALQLPSHILCSLFRRIYHLVWRCRAVTLQAYQKAAFERPRLILDRLLRAENYRKEQRPPEGYWGISGDAVVIAVAPLEFSRVRSDIPDWILDDTASSLGQIVMRRDLLGEFLRRRIRRYRRWFGFPGGR